MIFTTWSVLATAAAAALVTPKQDNFYQPTGNWKDTKPGAILAHRNVPNNLTGVDYSAAYQLLYRTTDALGQPMAALTTIIIPQKPDYTKLLSYQVVYDTPDLDCSPSYALQNGSSIDTGFTFALQFGWIINAPDYEGLQAAFTNGPISGQATLDSIRAAMASANITKIQSNATIAMWGYSGGALASEWAAELQSTYAPELKIAGTAMGGLTPNVTSVALAVNGGTNAGLAAAGIVGIANAYTNLTTLLDAQFINDTVKQDFYSVRNECIAQIGSSDANKDILGFFKTGPAILNDPRAQAAINAGGIMGKNTPVKSNKLYVYKTTLDEVSPVADTDALVEKYCKQGVSIKYVKNTYGTHAEEAVNGGTDAFLWLSGLFGGSNSTTATGCTVTTQDKDGKVLSSSSILPSSTATSSSTSRSGSASPTSSTTGAGGAGGASSSSPVPTSTGAAVALQPAHVGMVGALAVLAAAL